MHSSTSKSSGLTFVPVTAARSGWASFPKPMPTDLARPISNALVRMHYILTRPTSRAYRYDDLEVLPVVQFLKRLHEGGVF
jgi:hypothetical protein